MRKTGKKLLSTLLLPVLPAVLGGCGLFSAAPQSDFERVTKQLVPGGSYYSFSRTETLGKELAGLRARFRRAVDSADLPQGHKDRLEKNLALAEWLFRVSGAAELQAWGASSHTVTAALHDNRLYLLPASGSRGILWTLVRPAAREWRKIMSKFPADTVFALVLDAAPEACVSLLRDSGPFGKALTAGSPFFPGWGEHADVLKGVWSIAAVAAGPGVPEDLLFQLEFPDAGNYFFAHYAALFPSAGGNSDEVVLPAVSPEFAPVLVRKAGRLCFYNNRAARECFEKTASRLENLSFFRDLTAGLPEQSSGALYCGVCSPDLSPVTVAGITLPPLSLSSPSLTLFSRLPEGFLVENRSGTDWQGIHFDSLLLPMAALPFYRAPLLKLLHPPRRTSAAPRVYSPAKKRSVECRKQLAVLGKALKKYALLHNGAYPEESNFRGWCALLREHLLTPADFAVPGSRQEAARTQEAFTMRNCSFAYFGGFRTDSPGKLPLAVDWPCAHPNGFHVLYADGSIAEIKLPHPATLRRIVSYLYTLHRYEEPQFRQLLEQAARIDRMFNLE